MIARRLNKCFPNAGIIIVVREQLSMLRSIYQQLIREGYRGSIDSLINEYNWKGTSFNLDYLKYDLLVEYYIKNFSKKNVLVLKYEKFKEEPQEFLSEISQFCGIKTYEVSSTGTKSNVADKSSKIGARRFMNHFKQTELNPYPIIKIPDKLANIFLTLLTPLFHFTKANEIDSKTAVILEKKFTLSNKRLKCLLNKGD